MAGTVKKQYPNWGFLKVESRQIQSLTQPTFGGKKIQREREEELLIAMADEEASRYAQAVRFLVSLQSQKNQDMDAQRSFLKSKGLSEENIDRAFQDVQRPNSMSTEVASRAMPLTEGEESDSEAFERATQMFDQPLHASSEAESSSASPPPPPPAPPKTYPRSPLALYHQPQPSQQIVMSNESTANNTNPMTRYDVLLSFFRSMCYFLVLGGGATGVVVALYRKYLLPRMINTLDSRSLLLKHHVDQYSILANRIKNLRGNSLSPHSQQGSTIPRKGVLKKVQFVDEIVGEKQVVEEEEKKEAGEKEPLLQNKMEGDDVESSNKQGEVDDSEDNSKLEEASEKANSIKPIDVLEPVRNSLTRLIQCLKADMSASAIGTEVAPSPQAITDQSRHILSSAPSPSTATTMEEESDADSWVSEEDSDELEFDPYSPSSTSNSKRKHNPAAATAASKVTTTSVLGNMPTAASSTKAATLNSSLSTLSSYINTQTYMASAHIYGGGRSTGFGISSNGEKEISKAGDVAQIRADIRNLKGLLLSR